MVNKSLMLINYYWPPSGGPAVQRWLSLTNELAGLGWKIWVITVDEKYATYQLYDESLAAQIHPNITVVKTKTIEPFGLYKLLFGKKSIPAPGFSNEANPSFIKKASRFIRGNLFVPDPRKYWKSFAVKAANKLIDEYNIPLVITAGPPHSTHFSGREIKRTNGIKWVCDFHDLWTDVIYYDLLYHVGFIKKFDLNLERGILESCDHLLTVGEKYKEKLLSKSANLQADKISVARIGYDQKLFEKADALLHNKFIISYVGSIAEYYQPEIFFKAVKPIVENDDRVKIQFTGIASPVISELIQKYSLQNAYRKAGYVDHDKAVTIMKQSHVLLLINPVTKDEPMVIPGKIYEYLATKKPIINITKKDSETAFLINACNAGKTFERHETEALQLYLQQLYNLWKSNRLSTLLPNNEEINKFSHENIAINLNSLFEQLIS